MRALSLLRLSSLALGTLIAGCQTPPTSSEPDVRPALSAQVYHNRYVEQRIPSEFTGTGCDGQPLFGTGYVTLNHHFLQDAQGQFHLNSTVIWSGIRAEDPSGTQYTGNGTSHSVNEFIAGTATVVSGTYHFHFISRGGTENSVVHVDYHTTITPDGEVATTFDNFRIECRG